MFYFSVFFNSTIYVFDFLFSNSAIYVFEFKLDGTADAALKQIDEKGYLIPYTLDGRKLVKVGVNFSKETPNIDEYIVVEE